MKQTSGVGSILVIAGLCGLPACGGPGVAPIDGGHDAAPATDAAAVDVGPDATSVCTITPLRPTVFRGLGDPPTACRPAGGSGGTADITLGHELSGSRGYQIYGNIMLEGNTRDGNCHNAARAGRHDGVVICQGDPTLGNDDYVDMSAYHTFQWRLVDNFPPSSDAPGTVFYNWSDANVAEMYFVARQPPTGMAPDMQDATMDSQATPHSFLLAAQWGCGVGAPDGQYSSTETRAVTGDGDLENPRHAVCVDWVERHGARSCSELQTCIQCCEDRTEYWRRAEAGDCRADDVNSAAFGTGCVTACCNASLEGARDRCP